MGDGINTLNSFQSKDGKIKVELINEREPKTEKPQYQVILKVEGIGEYKSDQFTDKIIAESCYAPFPHILREK
jgi:hypothetical protein